ncbi:MAG TPA: hypothetical protein VFZ12_08685, partial [Dehalococcoidia bacterium]|nr:hypothetical protein [Dehalococcoidia bacterium]
MRLPAFAASVFFSALGLLLGACSGDNDEGGAFLEQIATEPEGDTASPEATVTAVVAAEPDAPEVVEATTPELRISSTWIAPGTTILVSVRNTTSPGTASLLDRD